MKKRKWWGLFVFILLLGLGIGGKLHMDKREEEKKELLTIQTDFANYLYKNYRVYTKDKTESKKIKEQYNNGQGTITEDEYISKIKDSRIYSDINKIEFTKFTTTPMNTVELYFTINDDYKDDVSLDTISAETNKLIYNIGENIGDGPYYLEKKKEQTTNSIPQENIIYYKGRID